MHLERFAQYWDDMDDWYWVLALKLHKARRVFRVLVQATAAAVLVFVTLLYRAATAPPRLAGRTT